MGRVVLAHAAVVCVAPGFAALVFLAVGFEHTAGIHAGSIIAALSAVFFGYVFYGVPCALAILLASPLMFAISRFRSRILGSGVAVVAGLLFGWLSAAYVAARGEEPLVASAVQLTGAVVGALAAPVLSMSWRSSRSKPAGFPGPPD